MNNDDNIEMKDKINGGALYGCCSALVFYAAVIAVFVLFFIVYAFIANM